MSIIDEIDQETHDVINQTEKVEYFECIHCHQFNLLKSTVGNRRVKRTRHYKVDTMVHASLKKFAIINNCDINTAIQMLLYNARTEGVDYIINERKIVLGDKKDVKNKTPVKTKKVA